METELLQEIVAQLKTANAHLHEHTVQLGETNARLDRTNARLDRTNARLDETDEHMAEGFTRLTERMDMLAHGQIRMATEVAEMKVVQGETAELTGLLLKEVGRLGDRLDNVLVGTVGSTIRDHEERIRRLERDRLK